MPRDLSDHPERVYMSEISRELSRHRATIVTWDEKGRLPEDLAFHRDGNNWRYWDRDQLERARAWVSDPSRQRYSTKTARAA